MSTLTFIIFLNVFGQIVCPPDPSHTHESSDAGRGSPPTVPYSPSAAPAAEKTSSNPEPSSRLKDYWEEFDKRPEYKDVRKAAYNVRDKMEAYARVLAEYSEYGLLSLFLGESDTMKKKYEKDLKESEKEIQTSLNSLENMVFADRQQLRKDLSDLMKNVKDKEAWKKAVYSGGVEVMSLLSKRMVKEREKLGGTENPNPDEGKDGLLFTGVKLAFGWVKKLIVGKKKKSM